MEERAAIAAINSCEVAENFKKTRIIPRPVSSFANTVAYL